MAFPRIICTASAAILLFLAATPAARADEISAVVKVQYADGTFSVPVAVEVDTPLVSTFTFTDVQASLNPIGVFDETITATFVRAGLVGSLTVADVCVEVGVGDSTGCAPAGFAFEDLSLGDGHLVLGLGDIDPLLEGQIVGVLFNVGVGSATFDFDPLPPVGAAPEPASLALAATGLLGVAGMVRRKMRPSA